MMKNLKSTKINFCCRLICITALMAFTVVTLWLSAPSIASAAEGTKIIFKNPFRPLSNWGPFWSAQARYWPEEGVEGEVQDGRGGADAIKSVAAGSAQMGYVQMSNIMDGIQKGMPIKVVLIGEQNDPSGLISLKGKGINELKDFEGKTVGIFPFGTTGTLSKAMLKKQGIDLSKIKFTNVTPGNGPPLLMQGRIDAMGGMAGSQDLQIQSKGFNPVVFLIMDYGISIPANCLILNTKWEKKVGREIVLKYVRGIIKGFILAKKDRKKTMEDIIKYRPDQKNFYDLRLAQSYPLWNYRYKSEIVEKNGFGWIDKARMVNTQDILFDVGLIKKKVDVGEYYTMDYLNDASVRSLAMEFVKSPLDPNLKAYYEKVTRKK